MYSELRVCNVIRIKPLPRCTILSYFARGSFKSASRNNEIDRLDLLRYNRIFEPITTSAIRDALFFLLSICACV